MNDAESVTPGAPTASHEFGTGSPAAPQTGAGSPTPPAPPTGARNAGESVQSMPSQGKAIQIAANVDRDALLNKVLDRYSRWRMAMLTYHLHWREAYDAYVGVLYSPVNAPWPFRSKVFVPATAQAVDSATAVMLSTIYPDTPPFEVRARQKAGEKSEGTPSYELAKARASIIQSLETYQFRKSAMKAVIEEAQQVELIFGTVAIKVNYEEEWDEVTERDPEYAPDGKTMLGWKERKVRRLIYSGPRASVIKPFDIYLDPAATTPWESPGILHRVVKSKEYLMQRQQEGVYANIELVQPEGPASLTIQDWSQMLANRAVLVPQNTVQLDLVEMLEYWGNEDLDGDGIPEPVVITVAGKTIIRAQPNPYNHGKPPFVWGRWIHVPKEPWGIGIPERIGPLQRQLNTLVNQRIDNVTIVLNRLFRVSPGADVDLDTIVNRPAGYMLAEAGAIEEFKMDDVTGSAYREAQELMAQIAEAVGIIQFGGPGTPRVHRTLGGLRIIAGKEQQNLALRVEQFESEIMEPLLTMWHELNLQFMTQDTVMPVVGPEGARTWVLVRPADIRADVEFVSLAASQLVARGEQLNGMVQMLGLTKGEAGIMDRRFVLKTMWENMKLPNAERAFPPPLPPPPAVPAAAGAVGDVQAAQSVAGQAARNTVGAPVSVPGAPPPAPGGLQ